MLSEAFLHLDAFMQWKILFVLLILKHGILGLIFAKLVLIKIAANDSLLWFKLVFLNTLKIL